SGLRIQGADPLAVRAVTQRIEPLLMPAQDRQLLSRRRVPETNDLVGAPGGQASPVGTVGQRIDGALMPAQGAEGRPGRRVPDVDGMFIPVRGGELFSGRAEDRQLPIAPKRHGPGHHGARTIELAVQMSPLPVTVLLRRVVEGPAGRAAVLELQ